jgi:hypothetical protein
MSGILTVGLVRVVAEAFTMGISRDTRSRSRISLELDPRFNPTDLFVQGMGQIVRYDKLSVEKRGHRTIYVLHNATVTRAKTGDGKLDEFDFDFETYDVMREV